MGTTHAARPPHPNVSDRPGMDRGAPTSQDARRHPSQEAGRGRIAGAGKSSARRNGNERSVNDSGLSMPSHDRARQGLHVRIESAWSTIADPALDGGAGVSSPGSGYQGDFKAPE